MGARTQRDYYAVLGIARDADRESIRRAFRSLAASCHPDVSSDPSALDRFRAITEAYEVLSRPETRARYDRYGFDARGVGGFTSDRRTGSFGLFDDLLDFVATTNPRQGQRGLDVLVPVDVEFLEAARGGSRSVRFRATAICVACGGDGATPGAPKVSCPTCGGRGRIREGGEAGTALRLRACEDCDGAGRRPTSTCEECRGSGRVDVDRSLLVDTPAGVLDGTELRIAGEGNAGLAGGEPGDLLITVRVRAAPDHPALRRLAGAGALVALGLLVFIAVH